MDALVQGTQEGVFTVSHPTTAAEIILQLSSANYDAMASLAERSGAL